MASSLYRFSAIPSRGIVRQFWSSSRICSSSSGKFEEAKMKLNTLKNEPGNEVKLKIYALFKQATIGENKTSKPGAFNFVGQAKWNAWHELGTMSQEEAKQTYVDVVTELEKAEGGEDEARNQGRETETDAKVYGSEGIIIRNENGVTTVTLNRPNQLNALTREMYEQTAATLNDSAVDDATSVVVLTGAGDFFCSGNDLKNFEGVNPSNIKQVAVEGAEMLRRYVASFIDFPKPLIAAINGPALGIAVTALGLCDAVYASDTATFETPFSRIGQSPECCSSYTFPKIMGHTKACDLMLFNNKMSVIDAERCGLVTKIFPHASFREEVQREVEKMVALPIKSLVYSKRLMRERERQLLHDVNIAECDRLIERWTSEDCLKAVMAFLTRK